MTTLTKSPDPTSRRVPVCELCRGAGLIPVRTINGAHGRVTVTKGGVPETVCLPETAQARCRCDRGQRFEKNFPALFDHRFCVSLLPGGEAIAEQVGAMVQGRIQF